MLSLVEHGHKFLAFPASGFLAGKAMKCQPIFQCGRKSHASMARLTSKPWRWPGLPGFSRPRFPGKPGQDLGKPGLAWPNLAGLAMLLTALLMQGFWKYFLCFLSIKTQHLLCVIGWLLTSLSNCINKVQHLSWQYLQLLDRWVQMYLSSARAKVSFHVLDPVTSTSSDKHSFFSVSSRRVLIFPSVARWHKLCPWNKIGWPACT